jgi:hypothetical protein
MQALSEGQEYFEAWNLQHPNCDKQLQHQQIHGLPFWLHLKLADHKGQISSHVLNQHV